MTGFMLVLYLAASAQAELLVHYTFDETSGTVATDASGNGHDGVVGGTITWIEGTLNGAIEFPGNDSVVLPAAAMGMTSDNGSVSFWMNCINPIASQDIGTIFWAGDNTTGGGFGGENEMHVHIERPEPVWTGGELGFWVLANPNVHIFTDPDKGTSANTAPVNPILLGDEQWHHVAATWGNGFIKLYIDGSKIMESAYVSTSYPLTHMYLGQMANQGRTYIGKLDDVRIFTAPLLDFEVSDLFNRVTNVSKVTGNRNHLSFYPNPASDDLNVRFVTESGKLAEVSLVNLVGQEVATIPVSTINGVNEMTLSLDGIAAGIYFVRLELDNEITVGKLMVR